jgi:hypothetical protein
MHQLQNTKVVNAVIPVAIVNNASIVGQVIDTLGFTECKIDLQLGATDIAMSALKVQESDTKASATALTSGADVTGLVFGTSNGIDGNASVLPSATDDNKVFTFDIPLRGRKRYLLVAGTFGSGSAGGYMSGVATLGGAEISKDLAADRGAAQILRSA